MALSRKEAEELKPWVESTVLKVLGFEEASVAHAALTCMEKGYDKRKTKASLQDLLDERSAERFCERLFLELDLQRAALSSRVKLPKRNRPDESEISEMIKKTRYESSTNGNGVGSNNNAVPTPIAAKTAPAGALPAATLRALNAAAATVDQVPDVNEPETETPVPLTPEQIQALMENAKKMIALKKAEMGVPRVPLPPPPVFTPQRPNLPLPAEDPDLPIPGSRSKVINPEEQDKLKRAAELQAKIKAKLQSMTMVPDLMSVEIKAKAAAAAKAAAEKSKNQAPKLIIDSEGRTLDAEGNEITLAPRVPELKANLRAIHKEEMKKGVQSVVPREVEENKYVDNRIDAKSSARTKRAFKFHDAGKFQQMASRLRTKAQLERLQNQVSLAAKKTGISSAARLAGLMPKKGAIEGEIPQVEWWDYYILEDACYDYLEEKGADAINDGVITNLIEHPLQMEPPGDAGKPVHLPIMLTKKERKKLRRQTRNEALKEKTEKVRLGLEAPPEPKMRISNLMRVLGTEAVADPTKMEAHVRAQMAKRQRLHEEANAARKLTPEQRSEKKTKKLSEDTTGGVHVAVYRVKQLSDPAKKFKVEANANQLQMTGAVIMCKDNNIVIVEGGPKQQKKFRRLLLHRIKWEEGGRKEKKEQEGDEGAVVKNRCSLVWEGMVLRRNFGEMKFKVCPTESFAREHLRQRNAEHYWDIAHADSVIENSAE